MDLTKWRFWVFKNLNLVKSYDEEVYGPTTHVVSFSVSTDLLID